jgi:hypothetical protein
LTSAATFFFAGMFFLALRCCSSLTRFWTAETA